MRKLALGFRSRTLKCLKHNITQTFDVWNFCVELYPTFIYKYDYLFTCVLFIVNCADNNLMYNLMDHKRGCYVHIHMAQGIPFLSSSSLVHTGHSMSAAPHTHPQGEINMYIVCNDPVFFGAQFLPYSSTLGFWFEIISYYTIILPFPQFLLSLPSKISGSVHVNVLTLYK